jgi:hypothetical protein
MLGITAANFNLANLVNTYLQLVAGHRSSNFAIDSACR